MTVYWLLRPRRQPIAAPEAAYQLVGHFFAEELFADDVGGVALGDGAAAFGEAAGAVPGWGATGAAAAASAAAGVIGLRAGLRSVRLVRALIERMRGLSGGTVFDSGAGEAPGGGGFCARAGIARASAARIVRNVFTVILLQSNF